MSTHIEKQIAAHLQAVEALKDSTRLLEQAVRLIVDTFKAGRRVYVLGNGGRVVLARLRDGFSSSSIVKRLHTS